MKNKKIILLSTLLLSFGAAAPCYAKEIPSSFLELVKQQILPQKKEEVAETTPDPEPPKEEKVYTTTYLNVRQAPSAESSRLGVLNPNTELIKLKFNEVENWSKIKIGDTECYVHNNYITTAAPENIITVSSIAEIAASSAPTQTNASQSQSPHYTITYTQPAQSYAGTSAKEIIAWRESRGDYNVISSTGRYVGRYQLTNTMLNGDYSPENQERVADAYVQQRYGSWEAALAFHNAHGWY